MIRNYFAKFLLLSLMAMVGGQARAQICGANNSYGCAIMWFSAVSFKNSGGTSASFNGLNCANTGSTNKLMTNGAMMDLTPGEKITVSIENTCTYILHGGIWIDLNADNTFTADECVSGPTGAFTNIAVNSTRTATVTIPCNASVKSGKVLMRVRC
jgi:hypothetical protein